MDIDAERLDFAKRAVTRIVDAGEYPATVSATMDRVEALRGADYVVVTILVGATEVWRHDIEIPMKYGVDMNVGDTRGVSGIFRSLRTIPVLVDIARDMERYCPQRVDAQLHQSDGDALPGDGYRNRHQRHRLVP